MRATTTLLMAGLLTGGMASAQDSQVYQPGNGVSSPRVVSSVKAMYPEAARPANIEGTVLLSAVVREDGTVGGVSVTKSLDTRYDFDGECVKAAKQFTFRPGMKDGKPVPVCVNIHMGFTPPGN